PSRIAARWPYEMRPLHTDDVTKAALAEAIAKLSGVTVASVGEHDVLAHAPRERVVDLCECDLPLPFEGDVVGNADAASSSTVIDPDLGQVQAKADAAGAALAGQVQARRHLA